MGVFGTIADIGQALGPILAGLLLIRLSYVTSFSLLAVLLIVWMVLFLLCARQPGGEAADLTGPGMNDAATRRLLPLATGDTDAHQGPISVQARPYLFGPELPAGVGVLNEGSGEDTADGSLTKEAQPSQEAAFGSLSPADLDVEPLQELLQQGHPLGHARGPDGDEVPDRWVPLDPVDEDQVGMLGPGALDERGLRLEGLHLVRMAGDGLEVTVCLGLLQELIEADQAVVSMNVTGEPDTGIAPGQSPHSSPLLSGKRLQDTPGSQRSSSWAPASVRIECSSTVSPKCS